MANTLNVTAANNGWELPLRGDMTGARLDFTPADNHFKCSFVTQDTGNYVITSDQHQFRALNASAQSSIAIGGKIGLFVELMYDPDKGEFAITKTNLVAGDSGSGGGGSGTASTVAVAATVTGAPGTAALVENIGTLTALQLKFTIPRGDAGATFPTGGTTSQYLGKTGSADGQIGWLTLPTGSGGSGTGTGTGASAEVLLTQDSNGAFTPDGTLGNRFRIMVTKPFKVNNPINYTPGQDIAIALRYDSNGPYAGDWGTQYAFNDRQPPKLPQQAGALVDITARLTDDINTDNKGGWLTKVLPEASTVGYGVASFMAKNITTSTSYYYLRNPNSTGGLTEIRPGQTLKIIRNALGTEAYGAIDGSNGAGNYLITGVLGNVNRAELRTGPGVRTAFDRGVLAFGGTAGSTVTVQDLILSGAREVFDSPGSASGINMSDGSVQLTVKNVKFYDNENGLLTGNVQNPAALTSNDFTGSVALFDCEFDRNGVGKDGLTHNIYMGHGTGNFTALRSSFTNCIGAHDIKSRMAYTELKQVFAKGATKGRELNLPVGGKLLAENCIFWKIAAPDAVQGNLVGIGEETVDAARPREYIFRNCRFQNDYGNVGNDCTFVANFDTVPMQFIDCEFIGATASQVQGTHVDYPGLITVNGIRYNPSYPPVFTLTGGPIGPVLPVGYQPIAVTPVAG